MRREIKTAVLSETVLKAMSSSSWIRKMFEEGVALRRVLGGDNVFDFSLGNPDLEAPDALTEAIKRLANEPPHRAHAYMPNAGYDETRAFIAEKVAGEQDARLCGANVVMACGAAGALNVVFKAVLNSGDTVIVPAPFFAEYTHYAANCGGTLKPVPTKSDFSLDVDSIAAALTKNTAAVLINSPNNPTGKIYSQADIEALCRVLRAHGESCGEYPWLVADEPYRDIVYDGKKIAKIFNYYENSIIVSSFAKNYSIPGERIGYIAVNPAAKECEQTVAACVFATRILGFVNAPAFFQRVITECGVISVDYSSYGVRRDALAAILKKSGIYFTPPEGAFYLFCETPKSGKGRVFSSSPDVEFCNHLKNYGVLAVPGAGFGYENWFRLAYCVPIDAIERSADAWRRAADAWRSDI